MTWTNAWPSHDISESRRKLKDLKATLEVVDPTISNELRNPLLRLLVVRACGHLELTFIDSFCSFAESRSNEMVANFVRKSFSKGLNPRKIRLVGTLEKLDPSFASALNAYLDEAGKVRSELLETLVSTRNKIAHGQSESTNTRKALELTDFSLEFSEWISQILSPKR